MPITPDVIVGNVGEMPSKECRWRLCLNLRAVSPNSRYACDVAAQMTPTCPLQNFLVQRQRRRQRWRVGLSALVYTVRAYRWERRSEIDQSAGREAQEARETSAKLHPSDRAHLRR